MNKFTFKMSDRKKLVVEKLAVNSCTLEVSGKDSVVFRFSKKRAEELVKCITSTLTYGIKQEFDFRKTTKAPAGYFEIEQPTTMVDSYSLVVCEEQKNRNVELLYERGISKKQMKKIVKVMKEVYGVE